MGAPRPRRCPPRAGCCHADVAPLERPRRKPTVRRAPPATTRRADRTTPRADHRLDLCDSAPLRALPRSALRRRRRAPGAGGGAALRRAQRGRAAGARRTSRRATSSTSTSRWSPRDAGATSRPRSSWTSGGPTGTLVTDAAPSFTLYRMAFTDDAGRARETVGVIGALEVVDPGTGDVLPHERTTPKATTDRLDLTRATQANLSPIWGLSLADRSDGAAPRPRRAARLRRGRRRRPPQRRTGRRRRALPGRSRGRGRASPSSSPTVTIATG